MFKNGKSIIICVDKKCLCDIQNIVYGSVKTRGTESLYVDNNKVYLQINTKCRARKLARIIKDHTHKTETKILGNIIFVDFK